MPFDPDKYLAEKVAKPSFDPDAYLKAKTNPDPTEVESGLAGALDSGTFGFADEGYGALKAAPDFAKNMLGDETADYKKTYTDSRQKLRDYLKKSEEANPKSYLAGNVIGGVGTAFVPGMGVARGASLANMAGKAALLGGLQGLGGSESNSISGDLGNAAKGAAFGGVVGGAVGGAGKMMSRFTPTEVAKKMGRTFLGAPEEATERYMSNPEAVNNALPRRELTQQMLNSIDNAQDRVVSGSKASRELLDNEGVKFSGDDVVDILKRRKDDLVKRLEGIHDDPERLAAIKALDDRIKQYSGEHIAPKASGILDASGNVISSPGSYAPKELSGSRMKDLVQTLQRRADYEIAPGQFSPADNQTMKAVSGDVNNLLKSKSPAYAKSMEDVSKDTAILGDITDRFKSDRGLDNLFKQIQQDRGFDSAASIGEFDKRFGTSYLPQLKDSYAREAFDKGSAQGSRKVNYFKELGESGEKMGIPFAKPIGATIGLVADPYGPKLAKLSIDAASNFDKFMKSNGYKLGDAARKLSEINATKGPQAAATALYLLAKKDESLRKALVGDENTTEGNPK